MDVRTYQKVVKRASGDPKTRTMKSKNGGSHGKSKNSRKKNKDSKKPEAANHEEEKKSEDEGSSTWERLKKIADYANKSNDVGVAYDRQLAGMRERGLSDAQINQANSFVDTNSVLGTSKLDRMTILANAQKTFNPGLSKADSLKSAEMMVPVLARYDAASKAVDDTYDSSKDANRGIINNLVQSMGALNDSKRASEIADSAFKYTQGTNQTIDEKKTEAFLANGNTASRNQNIHALFSVLEPVISDLGGNETAVGLQKASDQINGKTPASAKNFRQQIAMLGMANANGSGQSKSLSDLQTSDVSSYVQKLTSIYKAHGISKSADMQRENSILFGSTGAKVYDKIMDAAANTQPGFDSAQGIASTFNNPLNHAILAKDQVAKSNQDLQLSAANDLGIKSVFSKGEDYYAKGMAHLTNFMDKHPLLDKIATGGAAAAVTAYRIPGVPEWLGKKAAALGGAIKRGGLYAGRLAINAAKDKLPALGRAALPLITEAAPEALLGLLAAPEVAIPLAGYAGYELYKHFQKAPSKGDEFTAATAVATKGASSFNVSNPDAAAQYRHLVNPGQYPAVPSKPSSSSPQPVNLLMTSEGRQVLVAAVIGGISKEASRPRSGVSGFDPSELMLSPGSVSKLATN